MVNNMIENGFDNAAIARVTNARQRSKSLLLLLTDFECPI
jgi:hypothetical protein